MPPLPLSHPTFNPPHACILSHIPLSQASHRLISSLAQSRLDWKCSWKAGVYAHDMGMALLENSWVKVSRTSTSPTIVGVADELD